jgi:hypothetical protein
MDARVAIDDQCQRVGILCRTALARDLVKHQNEKISEWCEASDRLSEWRLWRCPSDLAVDRLDEAVKKLGLRGAPSGTASKAGNSYDRSSTRSGQRRKNSGVTYSCTRRTRLATANPPAGKGGLGNPRWKSTGDHRVPVSSHFRRNTRPVPGLKICSAHAGGYLASYGGRQMHCADAAAARVAGTSKKPSDTSSNSSTSTMIFGRPAAPGR